MTTTHPLPREAVLIVNARSRRGEKLFETARDALDGAGITLIAAHAVKDPAQLEARVRDAIAQGAPMVIVGGGDGSLSTAVDHFVGRDTVFALLPLGTANSFARSLGIPIDLTAAVAVIATGQRRRIDLGMIDDDYFANCAAIGLPPQIAETVPHGLKGWLGRPGYLVWAAYQLAKFKPFTLTVGGGANARTVKAVEVRIANGGYNGGTELVEAAEVDSGRIIVQAVLGRSRGHLLWSWLASALKLTARDATTLEFTGEALRVATDPPLPISIDGEVLAMTPVTARIAKGAIVVAAPLPAEA